MVIRIWCFELFFLSYMWIMSRKNNLMQIQTVNNNNYSAVGNPYTLISYGKSRKEWSRIGLCGLFHQKL